MSNLKMPLDYIKKQLRFNPRSFWNNLLATNCYAYALGIDIPEEQIANKAYIPGIMGSIVFNIQSSKLNKMSLEEKLYLDLRALDISHSECSQSDISTNYFDGDFIIYQWIIAIFIDDKEDFHFMRKSWDNDWWHKRGFNLEKPINYDDDFRTIYNPEKCNIDNSYKNAKYVKCLKLKYKRKEEFLY